jgi:hypothetical protein
MQDLILSGALDTVLLPCNNRLRRLVLRLGLFTARTATRMLISFGLTRSSINPTAA